MIVNYKTPCNDVFTYDTIIPTTTTTGPAEGYVVIYDNEAGLFCTFTRTRLDSSLSDENCRKQKEILASQCLLPFSRGPLFVRRLNSDSILPTWTET